MIDLICTHFLSLLLVGLLMCSVLVMFVVVVYDVLVMNWLLQFNFIPFESLNRENISSVLYAVHSLESFKNNPYVLRQHTINSK